jgi:transcriptional regulator with XRE-family HTH domain
MARKDAHKINIDFGNNLKRRRLEMGLSIREFAALSGIDHAMINKYERGESSPTLTTLAKIASAFQIEPFELLKN